MALPVLDGNQSATTLSSVVTGGEHIVAHTVVSLGSTAIANITSAVSGVTISGTVTVGNATTASAVFVKICGERRSAGLNEAREIQTDDSGLLYVRLAPSDNTNVDPVVYDPVVGNAYVNVKQQSGSSVTIGAMPNGALTTAFGTPTTASSVFATSAVTNANRKYLLIQNVTTQSNVITVGIGFTPTTTQGIQLTAGAGITFESSYIPTGQIYILSSVTASNFTILEA